MMTIFPFTTSTVIFLRLVLLIKSDADHLTKDYLQGKSFLLANSRSPIFVPRVYRMNVELYDFYMDN